MGVNARSASLDKSAERARCPPFDSTAFTGRLYQRDHYAGRMLGQGLALKCKVLGRDSRSALPRQSWAFPAHLQAVCRFCRSPEVAADGFPALEHRSLRCIFELHGLDRATSLAFFGASHDFEVVVGTGRTDGRFTSTEPLCGMCIRSTARWAVGNQGRVQG